MNAVWLAVVLVGAADWQLVRQADGITVSRRDVPGSDIVAFRGEGRLDAPIAVAAAVIFDTTRAAEWAEDLKESKIVRWTGDDTYVEYDHVGTPFILKDRDFVSLVKVDVDAARPRVTFRYSPTQDADAPENGCCVRGELLNTTFVLTGLDAGRTHVVAEVQIDPKGWLPTFIANWVAEDWPTATFKALRKQVTKRDIVVPERFTPLVSQ